MSTSTRKPDDFEEMLGRPAARRRVWLFVLPAALALLLLILAVAVKQGLFVRRAEINFTTPTAEGVAIGTKLKLLGFPIGTVSGVNFLPRDPAGSKPQVQIKATIDAEYLAHIPRGSSALLAQEGLIGEHYIKILPAAEGDARPLASGESLPLALPADISDIAANIEKRVLPVLDHARDFIANLNEAKGEVRTTLHNFEEASRTAVDVLGQARVAVKAVAGNSGAIVEDAKFAAASARRTSSEVEKDLPLLLKTANDALDDTRLAARNVAATTNHIRVTAPVVMQDASATFRNAADITGSARQIWPFNLMAAAPANFPVLEIDTGPKAAVPAAVDAAKTVEGGVKP